MSSDLSSPRRSRRRLSLAAGAWIAVALLAFLGARALDDPVGSGPIDQAQPIVVGAIVAPGAELTGLPSELPPLSLVVNQPPLAEVVGLPPEDRVDRLRELAAGDDPGLLVQLGIALQGVSDGEGAAEAYERALAAEPTNSAAQVGLLMVDAASGSAGLERATEQIATRAREEPDDQLVAFNQGWLAVYRRDPGDALEAWERARQINVRSPLGQAATQLVGAIRRGSEGP